MSKLITKVVAEVDVLHVVTEAGYEPLYLTEARGTISTENDSYTAYIVSLLNGDICLRMKHGDRRKTYFVRVEDVFRSIVESEDMKP